jgi:putative hydrolase of the HAD superfamily
MSDQRKDNAKGNDKGRKCNQIPSKIISSDSTQGMAARTMNTPIKAVLWDFGGVITSSPFEAFTRYEETNNLPNDFIRTVNTRNPNDNAWAAMERSDIDADTFDTRFAEESEQLGHRVPGANVLALLEGEVREEMVAALKTIRERYRIACLTNNVRSGHGPAMARNPARAGRVAEVMALFEFVLESSKAGVRKPEPRFYEIACERLKIAPTEAVYLDDLGINLKPARQMGMQTIKVVSPSQALTELEAILGHSVRP